MDKRGIFSLWLVPAKKDQLVLSLLIKSLAKKYSSFIFTPHITLYRIKGIALDEFVSLVRPNIDALTAFTVHLDAVRSGDSVDRTLYFPVKKSAQLTSLYTHIHRSFHTYGEFSFDPHISILYKKKATIHDVNSEIATIPPLPTVHITKLYIIQSVVSLTEGNDIPKWDVIHEQLLY